MKIEQLNYIQAIVDNDLSFSHAARDIGKSQPLLSKQVALLERELGTNIFYRNGKSINGLTPVGEAILGYIANIQRDLRNISNIADNYIDKEALTIKIAISSVAEGHLVATAINKLRQTYADVNFQLTEQCNDQSLQLLVNNDVDIALLANNRYPNISTVTQLPIYSSNWGLLVPSDHSLCSEMLITIESISAYPLIVYQQRQLPHNNLTEIFKIKLIEPNIVAKVSSKDAIYYCVEQNLGVGIIPQYWCNDIDTKVLKLLPIQHLLSESYRCNLIVRRDIVHPKILYELITLLAPQLSSDIVQQAMRCQDDIDIRNLLNRHAIETITR